MRKVIFSGVVGGIVILVFAFFIVFLMRDLYPGLFSADQTNLFGLAPALIAPMAGGFLAGLLAKEKAKQAGWVAGGLAGLAILVGWVLLMGFSVQTILSGLVLGIVIAIVSRVFSGFAEPQGAS